MLWEVMPWEEGLANPLQVLLPGKPMDRYLRATAHEVVSSRQLKRLEQPPGESEDVREVRM